MAMQITNTYSSYAAQGMAGSDATSGTKKKETEKTQETNGNSKSKSTAEYAKELAKLVPSVDFKIGNALSTAKSGKTLTINPMLLEKMQNDPNQEKETKELIKGVESAMKLIENFSRGNGWTVVYKHSYIDEKGKYHSVGFYRNDFMLNMSDKLREERRKNSEKLIEKTKEKAREKKEELSETLEEKSTSNKAKQLLNEKLAASKDGKIYLDDTDIRTIIDAAQKEDAGKTTMKDHPKVGANMDLQI